MEIRTNPKAPWALTREALESFLSYLDNDRDAAGEKYEQIRRTLVTFFRCNGCWNAEDHVDETIDRVIRRLGEIEVRNLMPFLRGVARHVVSEIHKKRKTVALSDVPEPRMIRESDEAEERDTDQRLRCLECCVRLLNEKDRDLVMRWFLYDKGQKIEDKRQLAEARGVSLATLRVQAFRIRRRLEELVRECLVSSPRAM
jgi:DNA-directed RNA polymerase specialized sigma24 family protein